MSEPFEIKKEIDLLKEQKLNLKNEISAIKSEREIAQRENQLSQKVLAESHAKIQRYNSLIGSIKEDLKNFLAIQKEVIGLGIENIQTLKQIIVDYQEFIKKLDQEIESNIQKLNSLTLDQKKIHEQIVAETKELTTMRDDLNVYRKRLEKKYQEIMPDQKIIL